MSNGCPTDPPWCDNVVATMHGVLGEDVARLHDHDASRSDPFRTLIAIGVVVMLWFAARSLLRGDLSCLQRIGSAWNVASLSVAIGVPGVIRLREGNRRHGSSASQRQAMLLARSSPRCLPVTTKPRC